MQDGWAYPCARRASSLFMGGRVILATSSVYLVYYCMYIHGPAGMGLLGRDLTKTLTEKAKAEKNNEREKKKDQAHKKRESDQGEGALPVSAAGGTQDKE